MAAFGHRRMQLAILDHLRNSSLRRFVAEVHDPVAEAIGIARTSDDDHLRHRVEIQVRVGA